MYSKKTLVVCLLAFTSFIGRSQEQVKVPLRLVSQGEDIVIIKSYPYGKAQENLVKTVDTAYFNDGTAEVFLTMPASSTVMEIEFGFPRGNVKMYGPIVIFSGDSVTLVIEGNSARFVGRNSCNYTIQQKLKEHFNKKWNAKPWEYEGQENQVKELYSLDSARNDAFKIIDQYKDSLSASAWSYLIASQTVNFEIIKYTYLTTLAEKQIPRESIISMWNKYRNTTKSFNDYLYSGEGIELIKSALLFNQFVIMRYKFDSSFVAGKGFDEVKYFKYIIDNLTGMQRQLGLARLMYSTSFEAGVNFKRFILDGEQWIDDPILVKFVNELRLKKLVGAKFFNFELVDMHGRKKDLINYKGKLLLFDFWYTGCGNCRAIHPLIDSVRDLIKDDRFLVVSVSVDSDKKMWLKSVKEGWYTSMKNENLYTGGKGVLHPLIEYYQVHLYPTLMMVDTNGKILPAPHDPRADKGKELLLDIQAALKTKASVKS